MSTSIAPLAPATQARQAAVAGVVCYVIWGFIPLAFQAMAHAGASPMEIVAHRALWSVLWAAGLVLAFRHSGQTLAALRSPAVLGWMTLSTALMLANSITYVLAVNQGRALDASLAYYLSPMLNMAAGAWMFRERISRLGWMAIGLAGFGVVLQAVAMGHLPWVSLIMGATFCGYGAVRKRVAVEAQAGQLIEAIMLLPLGAAWLIWAIPHGQSHFGVSVPATVWLLAVAPLTVAPSVLFAWAARRMAYSTLGFLQFIAPTLVFIIGVSQGEPFGWLRAVAFVFIWAGAGVYLTGVLRDRRQVINERTTRHLTRAEALIPAEG